ncbi:hypothetical protein B9G54_06170 [Alloscardovia macacae]|uniref:Glycine transporter domain-containing protein n=1 Tax=Alloscardovia macacae TaxID=1160091 RepID=A0A1Y2T261_9BIFI|nr:TRIC cation channel family protein [Alloscardovia macacae]OTA26039.1 hypothetical protein B9G54_06170 [Alloscardovia macacae]OTA29897.1 hypothetical protein B9T39_02150 [Alloscardovia macacae]
MNQSIFALEMIGTVAFAISGALVAMKSKMDFFGVVVIGVVTATFGGMIRDVMLGSFPLGAFVNPAYVVVSALTSVIIFAIAYFDVNTDVIKRRVAYSKLLLVADAIGLGIFTAVGIRVAYALYPENIFLLVFCGVMTGVGGGLARDIFVNQLPQIFHTDIYAVASLVGAVPCAYLMSAGYVAWGIWVGMIVVILVRGIAVYRKWNLPVARS